MTDCFVSIVAPLSDDEDIVEGFVQDAIVMLEATFTQFEIVLVDDASRDTTLTKVRSLLERLPGLRVVRLSRHFGQETAIAAGLDSAIGDYVVVMLPASDPPGEVPGMVAAARTGADVVIGMRRNRADDPWALRVGAQAFFWLTRAIADLPIPSNATHFRVLSRQAVTAIARVRNRKRYLRTLTEDVGYGRREHLYTPVQRRQPPRAKRIAEALELAVDIVTSNTNRPLRLAALLAAIGSVLSGAYAAYALALLVVRRDLVEGWVSITAPVGVLLAILLFAVAVTAEYVGHLLDEVKDRPLYHTLEEWLSRQPIGHSDRPNVVSTPTTHEPTP